MFQKIIPGIFIAGILTVLSGCNSLQDHINTSWMSWRNYSAAHHSWYDVKECYDEVNYPTDFKRGFVSGYEDVAAGGNGCPPLLPPRHYWKPCYMNAEGHCKTIEWFNGYAHGALAANQSGENGYSSIPISPQFTGGVPAGAEHHVHYPNVNSSQPSASPTSSDFESLGKPNPGPKISNPKNSEINIPELPLKKPYE